MKGTHAETKPSWDVARVAPTRQDTGSTRSGRRRRGDGDRPARR